MPKTKKTIEDSEENLDSSIEENDEEMDEGTDESTDEDFSGASAKKAKSAVHFKLRNGAGHMIRTFSQDEHGDDFASIADEFEKNNTHKAITADMSDQEKHEVGQFNHGIKHPIIGKKVE